MKKFLLESFYFAVFFVVFFILINTFYSVIIVSTDWDFRKRLETLKFDNPDYELLVLGASTAFDAVDAELLTLNGIKSYNLALGGNTIRTSYVQLDEYLTKYSKKPQFVLLGLNSYEEEFNKDYIHPIVEVTMSNHDFSLDDVPILKFKWLGFEFLKKVASSKHRKAKLSDGQLKFKKIVPDYTDYIGSYLDLKKFESATWIREIAKLCTKKGIELILLEQPGYRKTQNLSDIGPYVIQFDNGYSASLYNFNNRDFCKIFDPEEDWIGNSHLNEFGAAKFTKELIGVIRSEKPESY